MNMPITTYEMQLIPGRGQMRMFVELTAIDQPISQSLLKLQELGYSPELRYKEFGGAVHLYAVLREEQFDPSQVIDDHYRMDETIALFEAFPNNTAAVYVQRAVPRQPVAA